jgi:hypothetical protein
MPHCYLPHTEEDISRRLESPYWSLSSLERLGVPLFGIRSRGEGDKRTARVRKLPKWHRLLDRVQSRAEATPPKQSRLDLTDHLGYYPTRAAIQDSAEGTDLCQEQTSILPFALLVSPPTDLSHCFRSQ